MNIYIYSFLVSFGITILLFIFGIPILRYIKFGQSIRIDGPKKHHLKSGTPTMGGIAIIFSTVISFLYIILNKVKVDNHDLLLLIMPLLMYGLIGFIDDYLIVVKKNNKGISSRAKMFFQIIWAAIYYYVFIDKGMSSVVNIFGLSLDLKWGYGLLILLMLVASSNAVNLSDGLDGLAGGLCIIVLLAVIFIAIKQNDLAVVIFSICLLGGLFGFLCYNFNPAKVFMGNTGSLALGATIANMFILLKLEILLIVIGFVFVLEAISVILQVGYFKLTKGKRIFKMAPLHHHFELSGYGELKVDFIFWLLGIACAILGIILGIKVFLL